MFVTYERGKILSKLFVACFICTRIAAKFHDENGASNHMTDFPSSKNLRYKKDSSEPHSSDFQRILPVQVDFGSLVNTINHRILGMEGNVTNLDKQLRIIEQIEAKMQQEALQLREQLKSCKESKAREEKARAEVEKAKAEVEETNLRLKERLKVDRENLTKEQDSLKRENSQLREQLKSLEGNKSGNGGKENKTFLFVETEKTWWNARQECQKKGGDLAMHLTKEDLWMVHDKWIKRNPQTYASYWIGGSTAETAARNRSYEWVNEDPISETDGNFIADFHDKWKEVMCMYVFNDALHILRRDGTKGPVFDIAQCYYHKLPFLCEIY